MINANSVKDRLKTVAKESGHLFQDELVAYCLERTIYRISVSQYNENFTLKGGIFLYAIFERDFPRATRDIDLLGREIDSTVEKIKAVFEDIFSLEADDAIVFDVGSLSIKNITEFKEYQGINVSVIAKLDRTRVPVSIDIGFGDVVYPERVKMEFPTLLDMNEPQIYAYSLSSVIAEKFEAIVSLGYANSRYKDFYDIYLLSRKFDFDGEDLSNAIKKTFEHRKTLLNDIVAFDQEFWEEEARAVRWKAFVKKKRAMVKLEFGEVIAEVRSFLNPVIEALQNEKVYKKLWKADNQLWK